MSSHGRWKRAGAALIVVALLGRPSLAERLDFLGPYVGGQLSEFAIAGQPFSLLARLSANNEIPLYGYSLNVDITPKPDSVGMVTGLDAPISNFYPQQNLIVQGGGILHPILSIIINPGDGGLFVNGVNINPVPVALSVPGKSDILAELVFQTTPETLGLFSFDFGPGTVLSHVPKVELPFEMFAKEVEVIVPEPNTLFVVATFFAMSWLGRIQQRSQRAKEVIEQ